MPYLEHRRTTELHQVPPFPPLNPVGDSVPELKFTHNDPEIEGGVVRKSFFQGAAHRRAVALGPEVCLPHGLTVELY